MNRHSEVFDGVGGRPSAKTKVVDKTSVNAATMKMKVRMEIPTQLAIKKLAQMPQERLRPVLAQNLLLALQTLDFRRRVCNFIVYLEKLESFARKHFPRVGRYFPS